MTLLLLHLVIAFSSLGFTTYLLLRPSERKLQISTGLILGTLGSGSLLVITTPSHLMESCIMGLVYLAVTIAGMVAARQKLAGQKTH